LEDYLERFEMDLLRYGTANAPDIICERLKHALLSGLQYYTLMIIKDEQLHTLSLKNAIKQLHSFAKLLSTQMGQELTPEVLPDGKEDFIPLEGRSHAIRSPRPSTFSDKIDT